VPQQPDTPPQGEHDSQDPTPLELEEAGPIGPSGNLLNPSHQRFAHEYCLDLNAVAAYHRTYPLANDVTARSEGYRLLRNPQVRGEVQRLLDERAQVTGITADRVLLRFWEHATADTRELVEVRVGSCRHCWGLYHQHQFTDAEFEKAEHDHIQAERKRRILHANKPGAGEFEPKEFHGKGGTGYTPNRPPNPDCPECHGDGLPRSIIKDQQGLSAGALALFGGVKYDKNGNMQVLVHDRLPALKLVAEHLGMFTGLGKPQRGDPLQELLEEIRGSHGAGSALQIVHDDPEARAPDAVQDVEPKAKKQEPGSYSKPPRDPSKPRPTWRAAS
jgi:phage terminase small subunit